MSIKVVENFLNEEDFNNISEALASPDFPWFKNHIVNKESFNAEEIYNLQFTHLFFKAPFGYSNYINIINPLINKIDAICFSRIKANLNVKTEKIIEHGYHVDHPTSKINTAIWYVNTNDGYTLFEDGTKIDSVANRFVCFNSSIRHTGSSTTDSSYRMVINLNYLPWE